MIFAMAFTALSVVLPGVALAQELPAEAMTAAASVELSHDLSPWGMFLAADLVVKGVMIGLAAASVVTWTVLLAKTLELMRAGSRQRAALVSLRGSRTLADATDTGAAPLVAAASAELRLSADLAHDAAGVNERIAAALARVEAAEARRLTRGTAVLATIGATAPFVGLFGTVWGIMNSFIGISKAQTTNLAVVAPGIAEALLATALGLVAAIPAVVVYNHFARRIAAHRALVADSATAVQALVSRDLARGGRITVSARPAKAV